MSRRVKISSLYLRNRPLLGLSFFVPALLAIPFFILAGRGADANLFLQILSLGSLACGTAFFLASSQREMMARAFTFLLPGFRRGMLGQHLWAVALLALLTVILALVLPSFAMLPTAPAPLATSLVGYMVVLYALTVLLVFHFPYSTWLPFNAVWVVWLATMFWGKTSPATLARLLDQPLIWGAVAVGCGWWALDRLARPGLHRRCVEQPYLPVAHMKNPARIEKFKQARNRSGKAENSERRPGVKLMGKVRAWAVAQHARGHRSRGLLGEAIGLFLLTSIPRRPARGLLLLLGVPLMVVILGYYESYNAALADPVLPGYFGGFPFMWVYWTVQGFHSLKNRPLGLLHARQDQLRAGWLGALSVLAVCLAGSGAIWLMNLAADAWLPTLQVGSRYLEFVMPRAYLPWLPLTYVPVTLLVFSRWSMKGSAMVLQHTGSISFFFFHLMLLLGTDAVRGAAIGIAVGLWLVWPWVWRWRVYRTDLA